MSIPSSIRRLMRRFRDAITGRFVNRDYARTHPDTTVGETIEDIVRRENGL